MKIGEQITNPGAVRTRITLKSRSTTTDPGGFQVQVLTPVKTVWARWTGVHGQEAWAANSANALRAATVLIRYPRNIVIDETMVVSVDGDDYEIVSMDDVQRRHEYIELKLQLIRST